MTATTDNRYQEDNLKLYGRARQAKNSDLKYSTIIRDGRIILCSRKDDDNKEIKPRFSDVPRSHSCKATVVTSTSSAAAAIGCAVVTTPTSSIIKNEQDENTLYAFYYYQITGQDRNCNCYICSDLAAFKPKKQNDALVAVGGFAAAAAGRKQQSKRRRTYL